MIATVAVGKSRLTQNSTGSLSPGRAKSTPMIDSTKKQSPLVYQLAVNTTVST